MFLGNSEVFFLFRVCIVLVFILMWLGIVGI